MLCYRDMTFCSKFCGNKQCHRNFTKEVEDAAYKWWGKSGAPVAFSDFSESCGMYKEVGEKQ